MIALALLATDAHAWAWTKELGQAYTKAGASYYWSDRFLLDGDPVREWGSYFTQQYGLYGEVGLLKGWGLQLGAYAPLVIGTRTVPAPGGAYSAKATSGRTGDLRFTVQTALHPRFPLSLAVETKIPTYSNDGVGGEFVAVKEIFPKPGDGQLDVQAMLYAGAAPGKGNFVEGGVGVVHRTEAFVGFDTEARLTDGARFVLKGGHSFGKFLPILGTDLTISPGATLATKSSATVYATALIDVAKGVAIEPTVSGELWVDNQAQGISGGLGVSWRR